MQLETAERLHEAVGACEELQAFTAGRTRTEFLSDRGLQLIVWKLIEIVGEALRQAETTDPDLRRLIPELRDVINTRHRITHGYNAVNFNLFWDIVQDDVPSLMLTLRRLLATFPEAGTDSAT